MKQVQDQIRGWVPEEFSALGTDGFGFSDTRAAARRYFHIDGPSTAVRVLQQLTTELKRVEWRVSDHRSVAFRTRRTLFGGAADVRVVATPLAEGGSDVRIALQAPTRRRTVSSSSSRG